MAGPGLTAMLLIGVGSVGAAPGLPDTPSDLTATAGAWTVDLSWTAPADDGGSNITGCRIERSTDGSSWTDLVVDTRSVTTSYQAIGLTGGITHWFRMSARTVVGEGLVATAVSAVPYRTPEAPRGVVATAGDRLAFISWVGPAFAGGSVVLRYEVRQSGGVGLA